MLLPRLSSQNLKRATHTTTTRTKSRMLKKKPQPEPKKSLQSPSGAVLPHRSPKKKNKIEKKIKRKKMINLCGKKVLRFNFFHLSFDFIDFCMFSLDISCVFHPQQTQTGGRLGAAE